MLTELSDLQESGERVWDCSDISFTIESTSEDGDERVQRRYTFSNAPEWDKWAFTEFEECRATKPAPSNKDNWRRSRHLMWHDLEAPSIDIPPEVSNKLEELLGVDEITIQMP